jgi:hypothetical protein
MRISEQAIQTELDRSKRSLRVPSHMTFRAAAQIRSARNPLKETQK